MDHDPEEVYEEEEEEEERGGGEVGEVGNPVGAITVATGVAISCCRAIRRGRMVPLWMAVRLCV